MKRISAFLTALLLFGLTVAGCHLYSKEGARLDASAFGTASEEKKSGLRTALTENMGADSMPVFGSSEFQHGKDTPYHPAAVFAGQDFDPMLIGAGYYQCLSHAVTLASIEDSMPNRKAVLIVSPQWFRKTGVVDQAYASRFSETHYAAAMANDSLSDETRQYISDRTQKLLQVDEKMQKRVLRYDEILWKKQGSWLDRVRGDWWSAFLQEKELFETMLLGKELQLTQTRNTKKVLRGEAEPGQETETGLPEKKTAAMAKSSQMPDRSDGPDWDGLYALAEQEGREQNQNPFFIDDTYYKILEPHLQEKKDMNSDAVKGYQTGPEFDDLRCFLRVCEELSIEPMLVLLPVNGYYYDFTGFPKEAREGYYSKIRSVAEEYHVRVADFSDQEYTRYFFEDRVHVGKKGWLMIDESLYKFYKEA